jgi:hypothetical protein
VEHSATDYVSGDDFVVEFLDYRYGFSRVDFEQRVAAAAARLELIPARELIAEEVDDLVELTAAGAVENPTSGLGRYLAANRERIDTLHPEPASYWLRKMVFRGAWLDHRVKTGLLEVSFEQDSGSFAYRMPTDTAPLVELAPVPSWSALSYSD